MHFEARLGYWLKYDIEQILPSLENYFQYRFNLFLVLIQRVETANKKSRIKKISSRNVFLTKDYKIFYPTKIDLIPFEVFEKLFSPKKWAQMAAILFLINDFPSFHLHPQAIST